MTTTDLRDNTRRLRNTVEPVAAGVYFAPESHPADQGGVARPDLKAHFTSRSACMGKVTDPDTILEAREPGLTIDTAAELPGR